MKPQLLTPMQYGKYCEIQLPSGKIYRRVVRYSKADGLYIVIANTRYAERDLLCSFPTDSEPVLYSEKEKK